MINHQKAAKKKPALHVVSRGRTTTNINMGATKKVEVVKAIVNSVVTHKDYQHYASSFSQTDWSDLRQATKAFRKLIEIMEVETGI